LLSVPHAGETAGPDSVRDAVVLLGADRIGHGVRAIEDPALIETLRERGVVLEMNPTSNLRLHVYPGVESHPFRALDELGVEVTVNSDDPPLFNCTLSGEYALLAQGFGYEREGLARIGRRAFEHAGCPPALKQSLLDEFDGWAAGAL
jgi:adenosine deaminase